MAMYYLLEVQKGRERRVMEFLQRMYGIEVKKADIGEYLVCDESYRQVGDTPQYVKRVKIAKGEEVEQIFNLGPEFSDTAGITEGQNVLVVEGPYSRMVGTVSLIRRDGKVKVNVNVYGRMVPVVFQKNQLGPCVVGEAWR